MKADKYWIPHRLGMKLLFLISRSSYNKISKIEIFCQIHFTVIQWRCHFVPNWKIYEIVECNDYYFFFFCFSLKELSILLKYSLQLHLDNPFLHFFLCICRDKKYFCSYILIKYSVLDKLLIIIHWTRLISQYYSGWLMSELINM